VFDAALAEIDELVHSFEGCLLTTQAQRPGPRGRSIATRARWPGSLQRIGVTEYGVLFALDRAGLIAVRPG